MSGKIIDLAAWLANSYLIDGRRMYITPRNMRRLKVKQLLAGGRPGGDAA